MRFGLWYDLRNPAAWRRPYAEIYDDALTQAAWAESAGFHAVYVSEHHVTDEGYLPSVFPFLAALAMRTRTITIGTAVLLAPLHHPVRFAEDAAFVDQLSGGRLELGLGLGYRRKEFQALGISRQERAARLEGLVAIARRAWTGEQFSYSDAHWRLEDVVVTPPPRQPGGPPLWLGGGTAAAAQRAGRLGCHFMPDVAVAPEHVDAYRKALAGAGFDPADYRLAGNPTIYVTDDPERGWSEIREHLVYQLERYRSWYAAGGSTTPAPIDLAGEVARDRIIVGTPDRVIARIEELRARCPFDELYFWARLPGLTDELSQRSLELFAQNVIGHFASESGT